MDNSKKYLLDSFYIPITIILSMWLVLFIETSLKIDLSWMGVKPRTIQGLWGVLFMAFKHGDWKHLFNNTTALLLMLPALFYLYRPIAYRVLFYSIVGGGFLTWIIAFEGNHVGASGLLYALVSFSFISGIIRKSIKLAAFSLLVVFLHGSVIWNLFPHLFNIGISWEGHLAGFVVGFILALIYRKQGPPNDSYTWDEEDDEPENQNDTPSEAEMDKALDNYLDNNRKGTIKINGSYSSEKPTNDSNA